MVSTANSSHDLFRRFAAIAQQKTPFFSDIWHRSREQFGDEWVNEFCQNLTQLFGSEGETGWEPAVRGYAEFALDTMRSQKYFERNHHYRWSRLADIRDRYYGNEKHMMESYLPGMFLSHFLWPNHFRLLRYFRNEILPAFATPPALFYEVGVGCGIYSRETLRRFPETVGKGFDISPYSVTFSRRVLEASDVAGRYDFALGDILTAHLPERKADFVVSQEVIEHLEDPRRFVGILYKLTKSGGKAYITAAVNAALSDHIYLFRSPDEVKTMLTDAGWKVLRERAEYAYGGFPIEITPCVAAFFCERQEKGA